MAMTNSGGTAIGTALPAATIKALGIQRVQFDTTGTYPPGGIPAFSTFLKTVLGTRITVVDVIEAIPGGAYHLAYDKTNDTLLVYVGATKVEVAGGAALTLTNAEVIVLFQ